MGTAARTSGLVKRFPRVLAVDGVDLAVEHGRVLGLLGPNGAGKTTTLRCLMGYLRPTAGSVSVLGGRPRDPAVRARVGYLPGDAGFDRRLSVRELLTWYADLRGGVPRERVEALCDRLDLDLTRRVGELSTGNRRKLGVVQALMHEPELLVLDEPTAGLDPIVQREVLALVRRRRDAGAGVLFSSHVLPEVEDVADTVVMLREGCVVHTADVASLRTVTRSRVELRLPGPVPPRALDGVPGVVSSVVDGSTVVVDVEGTMAPLLGRAAELGTVRVVTHEPDLEQLFFGMYRDGGSSPRTPAAAGGGRP